MWANPLLMYIAHGEKKLAVASQNWSLKIFRVTEGQN